MLSNVTKYCKRELSVKSYFNNGFPTLTDYFKKSKLKKPPPRDKYGRPTYLKNVPFYIRYPRGSAVAGIIFIFGSLFSAPIYHTIFTDPATIPEHHKWWRHEIRQGKRQIDIIRDRKKYAPEDAPLAWYFRHYRREEEEAFIEKRKDEIAAKAAAEEQQQVQNEN